MCTLKGVVKESVYLLGFWTLFPGNAVSSHIMFVFVDSPAKNNDLPHKLRSEFFKLKPNYNDPN